VSRVCYIDISVPTDQRTTVFPGDPHPRMHWPGWTHEKGDPANVGFFDGGLHHGTHVDAPWHFIRNGKRLHEVPLERWVGPCVVMDLTAATKCVDAAALEGAQLPAGAQRLLFKTRNSASDYWHEPWKPDFIYIHKSAARWCVEHGIRTVGLDYLTIDPPTEPEFPAHMDLLGNEVVIVENINLRHVQEGEYELLAAPVNVQGVDGAWCRALLRQEL
jgi:arylformamidase